MMVKFYGRSVLRQYIKAKPHKYGIKLWAICCACCSYSLKQNIYLGSTIESVGGRDVVLQLIQPYLDKGHVIYCDRFFSHMDLAAYLRSRQTGMVATSSLTKLPNDLEYLSRNMHPLTWAYKWFNCKAKFTYHPRAGEALTKNCMLRSLYAYSSEWIRNIEARIRKLSLSPTVYHLSQKHRKISVM